MPITIYTKKQVLEMIEAKVARFKTQNAAAIAMGCTGPQLSTIRRGDIPPPPQVCEYLGLERVKLYASGVQEKHRE